MTKELAERVATAVRRGRDVDPDGGLALCFGTGAGATLRCLPIPEGTACVDELFVRDLAAIIATFGAGPAILAVRRPDGRPTRTDRRLWRRTAAALVAAGPAAAEVRVELLIVGPESTWAPRPASKAASAA
jgi:hypothetical protein